jgi:hypothetical protein
MGAGRPSQATNIGLGEAKHVTKTPLDRRLSGTTEGFMVLNWVKRVLYWLTHYRKYLTDAKSVSEDRRFRLADMSGHHDKGRK